MTTDPSALKPLLDSHVETPRDPPRKTRLWFGYLPVWSECVPFRDGSQRTDWGLVTANVGAGCIIGLREVLGGIVSASLLFSSADVKELNDMLPFGISMMWYSTAVAASFYAIFGRLQYGYTAVQDVIGILQAHMLWRAAQSLQHTPERIASTAVAIIAVSAVLTGATSIIFGKLGFGKYMLLFPAPVTAGFLGAIGFVILRSSLQTSSGVSFQYFYPVSMQAFCSWNSLAQVGCQMLGVSCIRLGPSVLKRMFPRSEMLDRIGPLLCQLIPITIFYVWVFVAGISLETLTDIGWLYQFKKNDASYFFRKHSVLDADWMVVLSAVPDMGPMIMMAVLCTMTGVLAITDRFPTGPPGDPSPSEIVDFDKELTTAGVSSMFVGCTGGTLTFHTFAVIQLRLDGGTHRVAVFAFVSIIALAFLAGVPLGHLVPKWYLSALFANTAIHFLKSALLSYQSLPSLKFMGARVPSPQYLISLSGIVCAMFTSPASALMFSLVLSVIIFLLKSNEASPVSNVVTGDRVVSRTMRPFWEMRTLGREGHRILLIYLQGQLFFGTARQLAATLAAALTSERVEFCILSFARVPTVDPSAVRHLKTASERMAQRGCRLIFCRMNHEVFAALTAAGIVVAPDADLLQHLKGLRWRTVSPEDALVRKTSKGRTASKQSGFKLPHSPGDPLQQKAWSYSDDDMGPDAFSHETDALDYCDECIVSKFCYGPSRDDPELELEHYMLKYREAATMPGVRLPEWAFEHINRLPEGLMMRIRDICEVRANIPQWTKLTDVVGSLCFIMRGAVSLVQILPTADDINLLQPDVRGFTFRQGKRLFKRYLPGTVCGKLGFFLNSRQPCKIPEFAPQMIVSSKLESAELWILRPDKWEELPQDIKVPVTEMLCTQLADHARHSRIQER